MKRNNQPEQRQSSIFIITILAGVILGVVLLGLISAFFVVDKPMAEYQISTSTQDVATQSTYFTDHFLNYGGETARIPNHFCKAFYNFASECAPTIKYLDVNVADYNLPIDKITSAATDFNKYIVYTVADEEKKGCAQKAYAVDLADKTTKELNVPKDVFVCGAIGTYVESLSPGGRFVRFEATGPASAYGSWLFDLQNDGMDEITKHGIYHSYLDTGNPDERDRYVIFEGGCDELDILTMGADCGVESVFIKDNFTGNVEILDDFYKRDDYGTCFANNPSFIFDKQKDVLYISSGDCLGAENDINNLSQILEKIGSNNKESILSDVEVKLTLPDGYTISKNTNEPNRRGSSISYNFNTDELNKTPRLNEIQFFTEKSIKDFNSYCDTLDFPCFFGDYPNLARYNGQKDALNKQKDFEDYKYIAIGGHNYLVKNSDYWDDRFNREYTTFINGYKIDIWIELQSESQILEADNLINQLSISN